MLMLQDESEASLHELAFIAATLRNTLRSPGENGHIVEEFGHFLGEHLPQRLPAHSLQRRINSLCKASGYPGFIGVVLDDPLAKSPQVNFIVVATPRDGKIQPISDQARKFPFKITTSGLLREVLRTKRNLKTEALLSLQPKEKESKAEHKGNMENLRASYAAALMELLQIEINLEGNEHRRRCMDYLRQLARMFNRLPPSFYVQDVELKGTNPISGGSFADVYKGTLQGKDVCIKVLRYFTLTSDQNKLLRDFRREVIVWKHLCHPNVLPFLGGDLDLFTPTFCMISPWLPNGNLARFLESHPDHDRLAAVREIAEAIRYLHEYILPIVHCDIRCSNILVDEGGHCLLADFGLAAPAVASIAQSQTQPSRPQGSTRWMAPELFSPNYNPQKPSAPARDIYAFACTVVEIYTGKLPFHEIDNDVAVSLKVMRGGRPERPAALPAGKPSSDHIWKIVEECWKQDHRRRPKAKKVVKLLSSHDGGGMGHVLFDLLGFKERPRPRTASRRERRSSAGILSRELGFKVART